MQLKLKPQIEIRVLEIAIQAFEFLDDTQKNWAFSDCIAQKPI
jgi:hypothetical protein